MIKFKNVEQLIEKLYETQKLLQSEGINDTTFVLVSQDKDHRHRVEDAIFGYFHQKYGLESIRHYRIGASSPTTTTVRFPELRFAVALVDMPATIKSYEVT